MSELIRELRRTPVIAAVRDREKLALALNAPVAAVFLLGGDPFTLPEQVRQIQDAGKHPFIHLDLMEGVSRDSAGVRWIARVIRPEGVLSTRPPLLRAASEEGLATVLRIFLVDASSLETGVRMVKSSSPDLVEVMPGLVTRAIGRMGKRIDPPVIAGGMVERVADMEAALEAGALAVSTSSETLWRWEEWRRGK